MDILLIHGLLVKGFSGFYICKVSQNIFNVNGIINVVFYR